MRRSIALLPLLLIAPGCGTSGGSGNADLAMASDLAPAVETCQSDGRPAMLARRYAVRATLNVNVKVPSDCEGAGCIFDKDALSSLLLIADVAQNGAMGIVTANPCKIVIPPVALKGQPMPTVLTAADALVQSVKAVTSKMTLDGPSTCAGFRADPIAIVIGARLAAPASDPLPVFKNGAMPPVKLCGGKIDLACDKAVDNGCVCDQDGDAQIGATVGATGIPGTDVDRVYLALRTVVALEGQVFPQAAMQPAPGPRIKGAVTGLRLDQSPVGCRNAPQGGAPSACDDRTTGTVAALNPLVTQSASRKSTFVALPVAAGYTCAQFVADEATLFKGQ